MTAETTHSTAAKADEFKREPRYVVFKIRDLLVYCSQADIDQVMRIWGLITEGRAWESKPPLNAAVVEQDWPEFEMVWAAIEARTTGKQSAPAPQPAPELLLRSRVSDLIHLLQHADIGKPSNGDADEARRAMKDISAMLAAAPKPEGA